MAPGPAPTRRLRSSARALLLLLDSLSIVIALLVAWQLWISIGHPQEYLMPSPASVVETMVSDSGYLLENAWVTFQEFILGFLLSVGVGVPLAMGIVSFRPFERIVYPILVTSQVVPKVAIAPLFLIWLGFGMSSKILIAFLIAFFPIVIETVVGLRSLPVDKLYLARAMGAGRIRTFLRIRLPNALPSIFGGLKVAIAFSLIGAVVGEFTGADQGIGRAIVAASATLDTPFTFAAVAYVAAMGFAAFFAIVLLERFALPWHVSRRR